MKKINNGITILSSLTMLGICVYGIISLADYWKDDVGLAFCVPLAFMAIASIIPLFKMSRTSRVKSMEADLSNLKPDAKFEGIYNEIRSKYSEELEKIRKKVIPATALLIIAVIGLVVMGLWVNEVDNNLMLISGREELLIIVPTIVMIFLFISLFMFSSRKGTYERQYKTLVVNDLVNKMNSGLKYTRYSPDNTRHLVGLYELAQFDKIKCNDYRGEDFIEGRITDKLYIDMAELNLAEESGSSKNRTIVKLFDGLFVHVHGIKEFKGTIKVLNDKNKMDKYNVQNLSEVKMDSAEFEKMFNVYSSNSLVAMQVLTSDIMEMLVEFETRLGIHYELLVSGTEIFIRFFTKNLFEPSINNEATEKDRVRTYYEILNLVIDIAKKLDKTISEVEV